MLKVNQSIQKKREKLTNVIGLRNILKKKFMGKRKSI